jgi:hypothetical protein
VVNVKPTFAHVRLCVGQDFSSKLSLLGSFGGAQCRGGPKLYVSFVLIKEKLLYCRQHNFGLLRMKCFIVFITLRG